MNTLKDNVFKLITSEDQKEIINIILLATTDELNYRLGTKSTPKELEFIIQAITIKRYNRLSNEGMSSISKDNVAIAYQENDFLEYESQINEYKRKNTAKREWRFL